MTQYYCVFLTLCHYPRKYKSINKKSLKKPLKTAKKREILLGMDIATCNV